MSMLAPRVIPLALFAATVAPPAGATTHDLDPMTALIREYSREGAASTEYLKFDDGSYEQYVLNRPGFPYADVIHVSLKEPDLPTRRAIASLSTPEYPVNARDLHDMKVWDLGYTKSRVGREVSPLVAPNRTFPGVHSVVKAGIDLDIHVQATHLLEAEYPAMLANYSLAAQMLRTKLASVPRHLWRQHGLRHDVLDRYLHARVAEDLYDYDLHYLIQILDGAMAAWNPGSLNTYGRRELPTPLRAGRAAAAYRERLPYEHEPCHADGTYDPVHAGMGGVDRRPLCFDDATDRAVHTWYVTELRDELSRVSLTGSSIARRMAAPLKASRQGWIGVRRLGIMDDVMRIEVVEAKIADRLLAEGTLPYRDAFEISRRALRLGCARTHR
jgi:hypothetical protein